MTPELQRKLTRDHISKLDPYPKKKKEREIFYYFKNKTVL
jgi:hypothetical protein